MTPKSAEMRNDRPRSTPAGTARDVTPEEVRGQLYRIVTSRPFANSPRLQAFLEYVVEEFLAGHAERIKAFSIGQAVFGGDENFDPQNNTIVRVEAGRLRNRLSEYHLTIGRDDAVIIDIPKGTYVPVFTRNETVSSMQVAGMPESRAALFRALGRRATIALGAGALVAMSGLAGWWVSANYSPGALDKTTAIGQPAAPFAKPFVAVLPLTAISDDPLENRLAVGLVEAIIIDLSKLSGLSVMAHASMLELGGRSMTVNSMRHEFGATHVLRGSLLLDEDTVRVNAQLIDTATNVTVWADRLDAKIGRSLELEDKLASQIADSLSVRILPDELKRVRRQHTNNRESIILFRQAFTVLMAPNDMERILTGRRLFQRVTELDPAFAGGYAGESMSHSLQVIFFQSREPTADLERAVALAKKAIDVDASFGMGYATLGFAYTLSGRLEEGLANATNAVAVQPGDAYSRWMLGVNLMLSGQANKAFAQLLEALRLDPVESRTPYLNTLGIAHYVTDDYAGAIYVFDRNFNRGGPVGPHMDVFRASAYSGLGDEDKARAVIDTMRLSHSEFPTEAWLSRWLGPRNNLSRTMNTLYRLGLPRRR